MKLDLFKKIFGEDLVRSASEEWQAIKAEWNRRHAQNFDDHRKIAELLGEILKRLDEIEKRGKK